MSIKKYRKKPVVIEAVQLRENGSNIGAVLDFVPSSIIHYEPDGNTYYLKTLEGDMKISLGDYIIKGVQGEFYPCKPDIFEQTYEEVREWAG